MLEGFPGKAVQCIGGEIPAGTNPISHPFPLKLPSNITLPRRGSGRGTGQHRGHRCHTVTEQNQLCRACHRSTAPPCSGEPREPQDRVPPALGGPLPHRLSTGLSGGLAAARAPAPIDGFPLSSRAPPARLMCPWAAGHHRSCPGAGTGHPAPGPAPAGMGGLIPKRGEGVERGRGDSHVAQPGGVQEGVGRDVLQPRPGDDAGRREGLSTCTVDPESIPCASLQWD